MTPVWLVNARCAKIEIPDAASKVKRLPRLFINNETTRVSFAASLSFDDDYSYSSIEEDTFALIRYAIISPDFTNLRPWAFGVVTVVDGLAGYTCIINAPAQKMALLAPIFNNEPSRYLLDEPNMKSTTLAARDRLKPLGLITSRFFIANSYDDAVLAVVAS